jgi:hypothetical protein
MPFYNLKLFLIHPTEHYVIHEHHALLAEIKRELATIQWKQHGKMTSLQKEVMGDLFCHSDKNERQLYDETKEFISDVSERVFTDNENLGIQFYIFRHLSM